MSFGRKLLRIGSFLISFFIIIYLLKQGPYSFKNLPNSLWRNSKNGSVPASKPTDVIVSGLVFYGRKDRAMCLWTYLQSHMVDQGGWLDEVLWVVNTHNQEDLAFLEQIVATDPQKHKRVNFSGEILGTNTYFKAWKHLERGKYYVKMDDDIVWIDDLAIPRLVWWKVSHPNVFLASANVVNTPPLGFLHFHIGALRPYLPEALPPTSPVPSTWKPSEHGPWTGPDNFTWPIGSKPPYKGHRWLRVIEEEVIMETPAKNIRYEVWGQTYNSWQIAAQAHYSLLEAIEENDLSRFMFEMPWYMQGERIRINFICVYADDILDREWPPNSGDEDNIAIYFPNLLRRPVSIVGNALVAHFQYQGQPGLEKTDLLERYQMLAMDKAVSSRIQFEGTQT